MEIHTQVQFCWKKLMCLPYSFVCWKLVGFLSIKARTMTSCFLRDIVMKHQTQELLDLENNVSVPPMLF